MKPLTDLQKKSQELWDESFDKYVQSMTKRKIIYYFVLIIITAAVTILGYIIDQDLILHMAEKDGVYRSPLFIVVLLLDGMLLSFLYGIASYLTSGVNKPFPYTRMKNQINQHLNAFDRAFHVICIILGVLAIPGWILVSFVPALQLESASLAHVVCTALYAFLTAGIISLLFFPASNLYEDRCPNCDMCHAFTSKDTADRIVDTKWLGTGEYSAADIYVDGNNVGSIRKTYDRGNVEKHEVTTLHTCRFCGYTYNSTSTYRKNTY